MKKYIICLFCAAVAFAPTIAEAHSSSRYTSQHKKQQAADTKAYICDTVMALGENAMAHRQANIPANQAMADLIQAIEPARQSGNDKLYFAFYGVSQALILKAYQQPVYATGDYKQWAINDFKTDSSMYCTSTAYDAGVTE